MGCLPRRCLKGSLFLVPLLGQKTHEHARENVLNWSTAVDLKIILMKDVWSTTKNNVEEQDEDGGGHLKSSLRYANLHVSTPFMSGDELVANGSLSP